MLRRVLNASICFQATVFFRERGVPWNIISSLCYEIPSFSANFKEEKTNETCFEFFYVFFVGELIFIGNVVDLKLIFD
jgi:hypothetical protein